MPEKQIDTHIFILYYRHTYNEVSFFFYKESSKGNLQVDYLQNEMTTYTYDNKIG